MQEDPKQNLIDSTLKFLDAEFVSAQEFQQGMAMLLGQMKDVVEEGDKSLTETDQKLVSLIEEKVAEINTKIKESDNVASTDKKELTEAIRGLKSDVTDSIKALKKELSDDIELAGNTDAIEADIEQIKLDMKKPVFVETGLTIKAKLLNLPEEDKLKIEELVGYDELLKLIEERRGRGFVVPQSGITTTFFSYQGTVIGRAKNINIEPNATGVTLAGDTATIGLGGGGGGAFDSHRPTTRAGIPVVTANEDTVVGFLEEYFFPPARPSVVLVASNPSAGIRESGDDVTSVDLTPTTTKGGADITALSLSGTDGYSFSYPSPNPNGATEATQTDSTGFSTTTSYTATVTDANGNTGTDTETFTFVFPYYRGVGVQNLSGIAANGGTLTKVVAGNPFPVAISYTTSNQVPYLVYPVSYGLLTDVRDINNFDVSQDWGTQAGGPNTAITPWSTLTVTNSFGAAVSCYAYQFENLSSTTMTYTFTI